MGVLDALEVDGEHLDNCHISACSENSNEEAGGGGEGKKGGVHEMCAAPLQGSEGKDDDTREEKAPPSIMMEAASKSPKESEGNDNNGSGNLPATIAKAATTAATKATAPFTAVGTANTTAAPATTDAKTAKTQSRIERKRTREKQRRIDINSQFNALAEVIREIEHIDLVEESRYVVLHGHQQRKPAASAGTVAPRHPSMQPIAQSTVAPKRLKSNDPNTTSIHSSLPPSLQLNSKSSLIQSNVFNPSNRIDLIAKTITQLSQLRNIRRQRTDELLVERRKCCEMKKEIEELRRLVAHYKAVGMGGGDRPQEKVREY